MPYTISGNLYDFDNNFDYFIRVSNLATGLLVVETAVTGDNYSIDVGTSDTIKVDCLPKIGDKWISSISYSINDLVFSPTFPSILYCWKCIVGGLSGGLEPNWNIVISGNTTDNEITWVCLGKIKPPVCHSPLIPIFIS